MKNGNSKHLFSKTICGVFCIFLSILLTFYYTTIYGYALKGLDIEEGGSSPKISHAIQPPNKLLTPSFLSSSYLYYGATTNILISTNGGSTFTDDTTNLLKNGYVGKVGENTIIRLKLTGYKYNENSFTYNVTQSGGVTWSSIYSLYQDGTGFLGIGIANWMTDSDFSGAKWTDSSSNTYYSGAWTQSTITSVSQKATSIYQYTRSLKYYTSPQYSVLRNGSTVSGAGSSGNTSTYSTISKSYSATYNSLGAAKYGFLATYYVDAFWAPIASTYTALSNTSRFSNVTTYMTNQSFSSLVSGVDQWKTADASAYSGLDYTQFSPTSAQQYSVYYDINLSTITDPSTAIGQYQISLDSGAVSSSIFNLSLYQVTDSPLTMQQSATANTIATDTAQLKVYNGTGQTMSVSTGAASGTLGSNSLTFKNSGYFTTANIGTFGSTTAMNNIELYIENKNLNAAQTLSTIASGGTGTYTILLKNANAISQVLSGTIAFNATFTVGTATNTKSISVGINSAVPQLSVSVPISIYIYTAKDGSTCFQYQNYYLGNNSTFPVSTQVSATLVQTDTTGKDSGNNSYFPTINTSSSFKMWIQSTQSSSIQFATVASGTSPTNFNDLGKIAANGGKLIFSLTSTGTLPSVATPGTYHYKIYFKFAYSTADYS